MTQEKPEKTLLQNIKDAASKMVDNLGDSFRDFTDFIVSLKDLATKRDNKKAKEFFTIVANLGSRLARSGVSKPVDVKARVGELAPPILGAQVEQDLTKEV